MSKKIIILISLVFLLGAIYLLVEKPFSSDSTPPAALLFAELQLSDISKIDIEHFIQGTRLEKDASGTWQVSEYKTALAQQSQAVPLHPAVPAKKEDVENLIAAIGKMAASTLISDNPDKQSLFEVTDQDLNVTFYDKAGKKLARFFAGKQASTYFSSYVRVEGSKQVYEVDQNWFFILNKKFEDWQKDAPKNIEKPKEVTPKKKKK